MTDKIGIIADDFTGASDIASFLNLAGAKTILVNGIPENSNYDYSAYDAIVIALKIRSINPENAVNYTKKVYKFLVNNKFNTVYFKYASTFDSTKVGNIGPVSDYLLETIEQKYSVIVPSFPENKRTVKDGLLYVDGKKIENTHMKNHPINPMTESKLSRLMESQSSYKAYNLSIDEIDYYLNHKEEFKDYISKLSNSHKHFYLIPDYYKNIHGKSISELFSELNFYTGASVFGGWVYQNKNNSYQNEYPLLSQAKSDDIHLLEQGIILAGSLSKATGKQIEKFKEDGYPFFEIKNKKIYNNFKAELKNIKKFIQKNKDTPILIYSEREKFDKPIADLLEDLISEAALFALKHNLKNILTAGGETSGAVVKKLDFNNFEIGESISPGVPILKPIAAEVNLVLKSGNFGEENFFVRALHIMEEDQD